MKIQKELVKRSNSKTILPVGKGLKMEMKLRIQSEIKYLKEDKVILLIFRSKNERLCEKTSFFSCLEFFCFIESFECQIYTISN